MRHLLLFAVMLVGLAGCMMPGYNRLIPENKDAHIKIYNPVYGYIEIDTRVAGSTNALPPIIRYGQHQL